MKDLAELQKQIEALKAEIKERATGEANSKGLYELRKSFLDSKQGKLYDLQGHSVSDPLPHHLYIQNGKKYFSN